jgi:hypothetical protein
MKEAYCSGCSHSLVPFKAIPERLKQLGEAVIKNERLPCVVACWYQWKLFPSEWLKQLGADATNQRLRCAVAPCWYQCKLFLSDLYQWCWEAFMLLEQPNRAYGSLGVKPIVAEHHAKLLPRKSQKSGYLLLLIHTL